MCISHSVMQHWANTKPFIEITFTQAPLMTKGLGLQVWHPAAA
jgi:hypothetical protein